MMTNVWNSVKELFVFRTIFPPPPTFKKVCKCLWVRLSNWISTQEMGFSPRTVRLWLVGKIAFFKIYIVTVLYPFLKWILSYEDLYKSKEMDNFNCALHMFV